MSEIWLKCQISMLYDEGLDKTLQTRALLAPRSDQWITRVAIHGSNEGCGAQSLPFGRSATLSFPSGYKEATHLANKNKRGEGREGTFCALQSGNDGQAGIVMCRSTLYFRLPLLPPVFSNVQETSEKLSVQTVISLFSLSSKSVGAISENGADFEWHEDSSVLYDRANTKVDVVVEDDGSTRYSHRTVDLLGHFYGKAAEVSADPEHNAEYCTFDSLKEAEGAVLFCRNPTSCPVDVPPWARRSYSEKYQSSIDKGSRHNAVVGEKDWQGLTLQVIVALGCLVALEVLSQRWWRAIRHNRHGGLLAVLVLCQQSYAIVSRGQVLRWYRLAKRKLCELVVATGIIVAAGKKASRKRSKSGKRRSRVSTTRGHKSDPHRVHPTQQTSIPSEPDTTRNNSSLEHVEPPQLKRKPWSDVQHELGAFELNQRLRSQSPIQHVFHFEHHGAAKSDSGRVTARQKKTETLNPNRCPPSLQRDAQYEYQRTVSSMIEDVPPSPHLRHSPNRRPYTELTNRPTRQMFSILTDQSTNLSAGDASECDSDVRSQKRISMTIFSSNKGDPRKMCSSPTATTPRPNRTGRREILEGDPSPMPGSSIMSPTGSGVQTRDSNRKHKRKGLSTREPLRDVANNSNSIRQPSSLLSPRQPLHNAVNKTLFSPSKRSCSGVDKNPLPTKRQARSNVRGV
jgi:hypothetical protein